MPVIMDTSIYQQYININVYFRHYVRVRTRNNINEWYMYYDK